MQEGPKQVPSWSFGSLKGMGSGGRGEGRGEQVLTLISAGKQITLGTEKFRARPSTECDLLYEHR